MSFCIVSCDSCKMVVYWVGRVYGEVGMGRIAVISDSMHDCNMYATVEERMKSNIYRLMIETYSFIYLMLFFFIHVFLSISRSLS